MSAIKLLVGFFIFYLGSGYSRADLVTRIANLEKTVDKLSDTVKILGNRQAYQMKIESKNCQNKYRHIFLGMPIFKQEMNQGWKFTLRERRASTSP